MEEARKAIEAVARTKGTYTESFRLQAEEEARQGRPGMLQAIEGKEELREDLSQALKIISTDLYTSKARFLMEVIQNADDNAYSESETPTLCISVTPRLVKIECNEKGFTLGNVQALCRTGRSSKPAGQGYTGEKGIGFKSVFKIAKIAHVRSPPYYFQLDKDRELGMITPVWDYTYFVNHPQEHQTTIILDQICDGAKDFATALRQDVEAINPMIVLFLRRLSRLHITLHEGSFPQPKLTVSKRFRRIDNVGSCRRIVSLENEVSDQKEYFYQLKNSSTFNGMEIRRPGISQTEIVLAFPVQLKSGEWIPKPTNLPTFAYLPLGQFNFKFIIQADFLTTSNRQSVDEDNSWNISIATSIPKAFVEAVHIFNTELPGSTQLGKMWPLYLDQSLNAPSAYWVNIKRNILTRLRGASIIETRSGSYASPQKLLFLVWAHDRHGQPLFGSNTQYVSSAYPESVRTNLALLGVKVPDSDWVIEQIKILHFNGFLHSTERTMEWHSDLAKVILSPTGSSLKKRYVDLLGLIPLIPLENGEWRTAPTKSNPIYFPNSIGVEIPSGLPLNLVQRAACECPHRKRLFEWLGVKICDISEVVKQIVNYHTKLQRAMITDVIGHARYLYQARNHLDTCDMRRVWFASDEHNASFTLGNRLYAETAANSSLRTLFSGYDKAIFLHLDYYQDFDSFERSAFVQWLETSADIATTPRFSSKGLLHDDFLWLMRNKGGEVLRILRLYWNHFKKNVTKEIKILLSEHKHPCRSGDEVPLRETFFPHTQLLRKSREYCGTDLCQFLLVQGEEPGWEFLSHLGVGMTEDLDFYLWILKQPQFHSNANIEKSKKLYLEIQARASNDINKVRNAFYQDVIAVSDTTMVSASRCVYHAPPGFPDKPSLFSIYGNELSDLFQNILNIPSASSTEVLAYLKQLMWDPTSKMPAVLGVYEYLQTFCHHSCNINSSSYCIAIPSESGRLDWKTPFECVWDDEEFSQNGLKLQSKTPMRKIIEALSPNLIPFFTNILMLANAGIDELLSDLKLLQQADSDKFSTICLLYERIQTHCRSAPNKIKNAFRNAPLVFVRGYNREHGQWVRLDQCIWARSSLRSKYALKPVLNQYKALFRDTLDIPNATLDMLVTEVINTASVWEVAEDVDQFQYCKNILLDISRMRGTDEKLQRLTHAACWPCRFYDGTLRFCAIGGFYVNDRQNLFEIFERFQTFLDMDFDDSQELSKLLHGLGCRDFLSERVSMKTIAHEPLELDPESSRNYRERAKALKMYLDQNDCRSNYELEPLLRSVTVWRSPNIETQYHIPGRLFSPGSTVTKNEGGSCVKVKTVEKGKTNTLEIYLSSTKTKRECALIADFPKQLVEALEIHSGDVPADIYQLLEIPLEALDDLLIRKGVIGTTKSSSTEVSGGTEANRIRATTDEEQVNRNGRASTLPQSVEGFQALSPRMQTTGIAVFSAGPISVISPAPRQLTPSLISRIVPEVQNLPNPVYEENSGPVDHEGPEEVIVPEFIPVQGLYSSTTRNRNTNRIRSFALSPPTTSDTRLRSHSQTDEASSQALHMAEVRSALQDIESAVASSAPLRAQPSAPQRTRAVPNRNTDERARDFEVGFLGEYFIYTILHDHIKLPNFTAEANWTSSLRNRAGFSDYGMEISDFTYHDTEGALTRQFQQMQHSYPTPDWLGSVGRDGNKPLYRLEVKSTTSQNARTPFYMSSRQYARAKSLRVTSETPSEIYVILRVSGLDALEEGSHHKPEWRAYLDPFSCGEEGYLSFHAPTYVVTAT